jgi:hypothetical protein
MSGVMRGKTGTRVAATAVIVATTAVGVYFAVGKGSNNAQRLHGSAVAAFARRGVTIGRELRSGNVSELRDAIAMPTGVKLDAAAAGSLAALRSIAFDTPTFREVAPGAATVRTLVTDSSGAQHVWTVTLLMSGRKWKLADSIAAGS